MMELPAAMRKTFGTTARQFRTRVDDEVTEADRAGWTQAPRDGTQVRWRMSDAGCFITHPAASAAAETQGLAAAHQ